MSRNRLAAVMICVVAAALGLTAQPAHAADTYISRNTQQGCPSGYMCAFEGTPSGGVQPGVGFYLDTWNYATIPSSYRWINNASGQWLNHGVSSFSSTRLFDGAGVTGTNKCLKAGYGKFGDFGSNSLNYKVSSHVWVSSCSGYTQFSGQEKVY